MRFSTLFDLAAQDQPVDAPVAVGAHHDQIGAHLLDRLQYALIGAAILDMQGLHGDAVDQRAGDLQDGLALVGIGLANLFKHIGRHAPAHFSGGQRMAGAA